MIDKAKLKAKIRALREMTSGRGCTEAEAMAAAEKAAELMREYSISELDLEIESIKTKAQTRGSGVRDKLSGTIAHLTNCAAIYCDGEIEFFGAAPGPEIAAYLWSVCNRALDRAIAEFKEGRLYRSRRSPRTKREAVADFTGGMVSRLQRRLYDTFGGLHIKASYDKAIAARDMAYPKAKLVRPAMAPGRFDDASRDGWAAGGDVGLHHGVGGEGHEPGRIEERKLLTSGGAR